MSQRPDELVRAFYTQQSAITAPRVYSSLFDDLPRDLAGLVQVVQGVMVYPFEPLTKHYGIHVSETRQAELGLRKVAKMLEGILALDPSPLRVTRPPEKRLYGVCRDFAVLLVAMLRHQGVPARERVGFAAYYNNEWFWDHRITEYWDTCRQRWVLVDARIDDVHRVVFPRRQDPLSITRESPFLFAGEAWQLCRAGQADPDRFVDSPTDRGMPMIRYALLHDFDALNKMELVGTNAWHHLIDKPEHELTDTDAALLDQIAELTTHVDARLDEVHELYEQIPYGRAVREQWKMIVSEES